MPLVSILGNVAIAKAFCRYKLLRASGEASISFISAHGKVVDASQEMAALGMCNIIGSFFSSFPVNASFSRAAVSNASGVRTPLAGIYTSKVLVFVLFKGNFDVL